MAAKPCLNVKEGVPALTESSETPHQNEAMTTFLSCVTQTIKTRKKNIVSIRKKFFKKDHLEQRVMAEEIGVFEVACKSASSLRKANDLFEMLRANPFQAIAIEKYDDVEAYLISPELFGVCEQAALGNARLFDVPIANIPVMEGESIPTKRVLASETTRVGDGAQSWSVLVDGFGYELTVHDPRGATRRKMQPDQLLWRHHADVALRVIEAFPWRFGENDEEE